MAERLYEEVTCRYFRAAGEANTEAALAAAVARARQRGIGTLVVASCSGQTALAAVRMAGPGIRVVAVTHVTGFVKPDFQELSTERRQQLEAAGAVVLTAQHAFGGVGRAVRRKLSTYQVDEIMAYALRTFGQGTKVAIEVTLMAADAGLVRTDEDVIALGGTAQGVDTALVIRPANSADFFDLKVKEIVCKPAGF
jgi:uncharacterized protein